MKNTLFGLAAALLLASPAAAQGPPEALLHGHLDNALGDPLTVSWRSQPLALQDVHRTVHPDIDGNFRLRLPLTQPTLVQLSFGDEEIPVFLEPGNALELRGDAIELGTTATFKADEDASKPAAAANDYLVELSKRYLNNESYQVLPDNIKLLETGFLSFLDYRRSHEQDLLKQANRRGHFTPAFLAYAEADLTYAYASDRLSYADLREQTVADQQQPELAAGYYNFLQESSLLPGNPAGAASPRYQEFLLDYVHYQAQATGHRPADPDYFPTCYRLADQLLAASPLRPVVLGRVVRETIGQGHIAHAQALLDRYAATAQAPAGWVAQLRGELLDHRNLAIGSPAPALKLRYANGRPLTLTELRSKLVYLVFWDSSSPAGQRLLPYAKQLTLALAGQPVEVVMAALDSTPTYWQQHVACATPAPSGIQTYLPLDQQAAIRQAYGLTRLPSAVLIAEDGTLLNLHPHDLSSRQLQDDLRAAVGRAAAYRAVALGNL